jgi:hypothetical protein
MKHRHALENRDKDLPVVQELEIKLGVNTRWQTADPQWKAAAIMVGKRRYQRVLDELEGLVVSRMFELTKMNMSQTGAIFLLCLYILLIQAFIGYKLRKHIATVLRARSLAIRNSLDRYNTAASALSPACPNLS